MSELTLFGLTVAQAMDRVKRDPANALNRFGLFRMFVLTGQWSRAATQLATAIQMDAGQAMYGTTYHPCLNCEGLRSQVFAPPPGSEPKAPVFLGEPAQWQALLLQALRTEDTAAREKVMLEALELAPQTGGQVDGRPFEWACDADHRFGPQFELFVDGKYYWVSFDRIESLRMLERTDLIDHIWMPVDIVLKGGGSKSGYLPSRYPGSELSTDAQIVSAKTTRFTDLGEQLQFATGARQLIFDDQAMFLAETTSLAFSAEPV